MKYLVSYYKYQHDDWQDLEAVVEAEDEKQALQQFQDENRLARKLTIKPYKPNNYDRAEGKCDL